MIKANAGMRLMFGLLWLAVGFVSGGATCARREPALTLPPPPPIWNATPTLDDVVASVNRTATVRELSSNTATVDLLSMPSVPKLSATLAIRREKEFRLRASLPIVMGSGLDMGSNHESFWFEVPEGMGRTLYFARHDQYQQQLDRAILPVDPTWVTDALGLVQLDASKVARGPSLRADGKLEVLSLLPMAAGTFQRVCYIDAQAGHVTDQYLYAPSGVQIAESHASNHQYYAEQRCALPHRVQISLTPSNGPPLQMQIDIGSYAINQILSGDPNLFVMPQGASQAVDLTNLGPAAVTNGVQPTSYQAPDYQSNQIGPMPYRGMIQSR